MPPPRPTPPPGEPRRRPSPAMSNGWVIWVVLIGMAMLMFWVIEAFKTAERIEYSQFWKLLDDNKIKKVTFVGKDKITGALKDDAVKDDAVKELKLRGGEFSVNLPAEGDPDLIKKLKEK